MGFELGDLDKPLDNKDWGGVDLKSYHGFGYL